jgi:3',5'-cyclic AMP phosphodiesterase CpdA
VTELDRAPLWLALDAAPPPVVTGRILHISDLHLCHTTAPVPLESLRELIPGLDPEVMVVTGDLTHRGRPAELERARELLQGLGLTLLAVPGNHDIPYVFPTRFTRTREAWERVFGTAQPVYTSDRIAIVGMNSVRPWRQQGGAIGASQLDRLAPKLEGATAGALRVVALHHHLAAPPWRAAHKRPVRHRDLVLQRLVSAGVELVLSGHVHQSAAAELREFEVVDPDQRSSIVLATAAGFGRPRPDRRGEALGFNYYDFDPRTISVVTWSWSGGAFAEVGRRTFQRGQRDGASSLSASEAVDQTILPA